MLGRGPVAHEEQRDGPRRFLVADIAAELGRSHVEEIEAEDDELRLLELRLLQPFAAGERGQDQGLTSAQDRFLEEQRAARMIDEENAPRLSAIQRTVSHAAEISRNRATLRFRSSISIVTCSAVFDLPSPNRIEPSAASSLLPMARSTGDAPRSPELHAEPDESANLRMATISE